MIRSIAQSRVCAAFLRILLLPLLALAFVVVSPLAYSDTAHAQEVRERRSIIDLFFGRTKKAKPPQQRVKKVRRKKAATNPGNAAVTGAEIAVEKLPTAQKVLVIGDFMATALADGLTAAFAGDPNIAIEKRTDGSSGLVRTDHLDWPQTLNATIGEVKPALIVIMLGANDRQQMSVNGTKQKFQTQEWNTEYERRIAALINVAASAKVPFIWTGLPSFQSPSLSADAATLNNLYRAKSELAGGEFIDIWDGFADENGKFIASGSDINGQPVRLRGSDGLSLTRAGKRKMAFYLEKSIRKRIGVEALPSTLQLTALPDTQQPVAAQPTIADITTVPPISLADPELDGAAGLLDANLIPKSTGLTPRDKLIEKGETVEAPEGRLDDFRIRKDEKPAG